MVIADTLTLSFSLKGEGKRLHGKGIREFALLPRGKRVGDEGAF
jgi:hypothetical protein